MLHDDVIDSDANSNYVHNKYRVRTQYVYCINVLYAMCTLYTQYVYAVRTQYVYAVRTQYEYCTNVHNAQNIGFQGDG